MHAVGVNPVETYIRSGIYPKPPTPYTPGNDGAGVIAAIGPDVKSVAVGDRVYIAGSSSGTYAELSVCSAKRISTSRTSLIRPRCCHQRAVWHGVSRPVPTGTWGCQRVYWSTVPVVVWALRPCNSPVLLA